jgi:adenosylcobinamide-phosphate synthase
VIIILSLLIDRWWGEPPAGIHPVVWMGQYLKWAGHGLRDRAPSAAFLLGALLWILGATAVAALYGYADLVIGRQLPWWLQIAVTGLLLKPLLALRMLLGEVQAVEQSLNRGLDCGRERLRMIVSRDTTELDSGQIRESALESLAENLSDSVVAPLFWFVLFGLPGAAVYRFANTADAMWGYRGRWEWAGKFAARVDDFLNLIPARVTAVGLLLVGPDRITLLRRLPGEAARTPSPNSGWPMSAMALSLNVQLRKPEVYVLNERGSAPADADVWTALRRSELTAWIIAGLLAIGMQVVPRVGYG